MTSKMPIARRAAAVMQPVRLRRCGAACLLMVVSAFVLGALPTEDVSWCRHGFSHTARPRRHADGFGYWHLRRRRGDIVACRAVPPKVPENYRQSDVQPRGAGELNDPGSSRVLGIVTPIGPLCPFSSAACAEDSFFGQEVNDLVLAKMPQLFTEVAELQGAMESGNFAELMQRRGRMATLADDLTMAEEEWRVLLARMRLATDFQSRELYKVAEAWTRRQGETLESMGSKMRYSADTMRAVSIGQAPTPPPAGYDPIKLMRLWMRQGSAAGLSVVTTMAAGGGVDALPFTGSEAVFQSEVVVAEYDQLCKDHKALISFGEQFGSFDPLGQVAFLDALAAVEERWDVFFSRARLVGELGPEYEDQTECFLKSLDMDAQQFRELLFESHELLRKDAEEARNRGPV